MLAAEKADPDFPWRSVRNTDLDLAEIQDGYVPDLIVLDAETLAEAEDADAPCLFPCQVALVVDITSPAHTTAMTGCASADIPYLLIDRDPAHASTTFYTSPNRNSGTYDQHRSWEFGEVIRLPEPFGFEIPTQGWRPWQVSRRQ